MTLRSAALPSRRNLRLFILILVGIGITALLNASSLRSWVVAQVAGQGLEISPPSQELTADPGQQLTFKVKITNRSSSSLPIKVSVEDFTASGEEGQVSLSSGSPWSVISWTKVNPSSFVLPPQDTREVTAKVTIPKDAAGGRYGSLIFGVEPTSTPGQNAAIVSQQIASLFLLRISGPVTEDLRLTSFSGPAFEEFGPIPFSLRFENKGNVHIKTYGLVNVTDMFGRKVADIVVPGTNVFPKASRVIEAKLNQVLLFGPLTATAIMYYGSQNQVVNATTIVWVFPLRIATGVIVVLIIFFVLRRRLLKAFRVLFRG